MLTLPLALRYAGQALRPAVAWLIPGDEPHSWLAQIIAAGAATHDVTLLPLPGGVVLLSDIQLRPQPGWQPLGRAGRRVYLSVDAAIEPPVNDDELDEILPSDAVATVAHPVIGWVHFEAGNVVRLSDLLVRPRQRDADWGHAREGIAFTRRIAAIHADAPIDLVAMLDEAGDDIGEDSDALGELPPSPDEPAKKPNAGMSRAMKRAMARFILNLTKHSPRTATQPTWVNRVEDWARNLLGGRSQADEERRRREIQRLLHMLETEPDKGLRYAIPLTSDPHRGQAAPGNDLVSHGTDYSGQRRGGAADFWGIEAAQRQQMRQKYRDLANRELHLGRFGRAAYIFAELLGDFSSAASALEQGQRYREAAAIYRERLRRPTDAARCLERGGHWTEAIAIYEELEQWETIGDLYTRLEGKDAARPYYLREVARQHSSDDRLRAAQILEQKLAMVDDAIAELSDGWPASKQATRCLRALFSLYGRTGRHGEAQERLTALYDERLTTEQYLDLSDEMARLAVEYPDRVVTHHAADRTRYVVAARIKHLDHFGQRRVVNALSRLVPSDKLLGRDCARFVTQFAAPRPKPQAEPRLLRSQKCSVVTRIPLPEDVQWKSLISDGASFVAAGYRDGEIELLRGRWNGHTSTKALGKRWRVATIDAPILLAADSSLMRTAYVHVVGNTAFHYARTFPGTDEFESGLVLKSHAAFSPSCVAFSCSPLGPTWIAEHQDDAIVLKAYQATGQLSTTQARIGPAQFTVAGTPRVALYATNARVYLAIDEQLTNGRGQTFELPSRVSYLAGSAHHSRRRVAAACERGGLVVWDDFGGVDAELFGLTLESPVVTFTPRGWLVAASSDECHVYSSQEKRLTRHASAEPTHRPPIAVVPTDHADQFAVCDGRYISVFQVPVA